MNGSGRQVRAKGSDRKVAGKRRRLGERGKRSIWRGQVLLFPLALLAAALVAPPVGARMHASRSAPAHRHHKRHKHHKRHRHLTPPTATVFEGTPCGPFPTFGTAPPDPTIVAAARQYARQRLKTVNLPPGAGPANDNPAHLDGPPECSSNPDQVDFYDLWTAPGNVLSVIAWVKAHPPEGSQFTASGGSSQCPPGGQAGPCRITSSWIEFDWQPAPGAPEGVTLSVLAVPVSSTQVALRVDAIGTWENPRPASEKVPSGVSSVTIVVTYSDGSESGPYVVNDPSKIDQIVSLTNALPARQPGVYSCPAGFGTIVHVTFSAANGTSLAQADADPQGCGEVDFSINGQPQPLLTGGSGYVQQLESLVGFTVKSPTP